jgi:hypothetical protein
VESDPTDFGRRTITADPKYRTSRIKMENEKWEYSGFLQRVHKLPSV